PFAQYDSSCRYRQMTSRSRCATSVEIVNPSCRHMRRSLRSQHRRPDSITMMPAKRGPSSFAIWTAMASVYVIWGSTYLAIAIAVQTLPPLFSAGLRFLVAGLVLLAFVAARRRVWVERAQLVGASIVGLLLLVGGNGF